ncbi:UTRA domain-containing protein [Nonomuraea sp. PA05]|uniref:GntR family transcriptional regulator n=1 Tax=Nonomuraea sp. PA05 TaxID=2604466 RepID=UPI0011DA9485|nr:UTRA domain-containing protein [Nonomuraea sp. PA05]TYB52751.1 UTRA domain-containing protein [Nonomuraea sp. PA05]
MRPSGWSNTSAPYIRPRPDGEPDAWTEEAAQRGHAGTNELREVGEIPAPADIARDLNIGGEPQQVVVRRRIVLLDGVPIELADSYYPASIARGTPLAQPGKIRGGAVRLLAELGYRARKVEETVSARPATATERELLRLDEADWVLVLRRVTCDHAGTPYESTVMTMVASGRELRYEHEEG